MRLITLGLALTLCVAACSSSDDTSTPATTSTAAGTTPVTRATEPDLGEPAVWFARFDSDLTNRSAQFTAEVSRLGCNGGVTGKVLAPSIEPEPGRVVVTFTVAPTDPGFHECPSNVPVHVVVDLGEAVGSRPLVDGACLAGGAATSTSHCSDGPVRWKASSGPTPLSGPGWGEPYFDLRRLGCAKSERAAAVNVTVPDPIPGDLRFTVIDSGPTGETTLFDTIAAGESPYVWSIPLRLPRTCGVHTQHITVRLNSSEDRRTLSASQRLEFTPGSDGVAVASVRPTLR